MKSISLLKILGDRVLDSHTVFIIQIIEINPQPLPLIFCWLGMISLVDPLFRLDLDEISEKDTRSFLPVFS